MKKRISGFFLAFLLVLSIAFGGITQKAYAYETPCSNGPYHLMEPSGSGICVYSANGTYLFTGGLYKCKYCGETMICQGTPQSERVGLNAINNYCDIGTFNVTYSVNGVQAARMTATGVVRYTDAPNLPGYQFRSAY